VRRERKEREKIEKKGKKGKKKDFSDCLTPSDAYGLSQH
jgi:hypothetical protein